MISLALEGRFALLHDHDTQLARERQLVPETQQLIPFVRPAFYALMIAPLALLPYHTAFWVWMALQVSLAAICIWWGCRRFGPDAASFACMYAPMALSIPHGQDALDRGQVGIHRLGLRGHGPGRRDQSGEGAEGG